jgi:hypothetical protein
MLKEINQTLEIHAGKDETIWKTEILEMNK